MTPRLVSLPMYDPPRPALDRLLAALIARLTQRGFSPEPVEPADLVEHWGATDLLLSQTCGYPLTTSLKDRVRVVGVPCYDAPGCQGPLYRSAIVVRSDDPAGDLPDLRGRVAAFNARHSQSGYNAFRARIAPLAQAGRFFGSTVETGSHRASIDAVLKGQADTAAIDAVTLALALDREPDLPLRTLAFTAPAPGLPFVTSAAADDAQTERLAGAVADAIADVRGDTALRLLGFERLPLSAFAVIQAQELEARALGYGELF